MKSPYYTKQNLGDMFSTKHVLITLNFNKPSVKCIIVNDDLESNVQLNQMELFKGVVCFLCDLR